MRFRMAFLPRNCGTASFGSRVSTVEDNHVSPACHAKNAELAVGERAPRGSRSFSYGLSRFKIVIARLLSLSSNVVEVGAAKSVQDVPSKRMPFVQQWVVEVVASRVGHADFLHHPTGADVARYRVRDDLL